MSTNTANIMSIRWALVKVCENFKVIYLASRRILIPKNVFLFIFQLVFYQRCKRKTWVWLKFL
jgi:hypothetical protein